MLSIIEDHIDRFILQNDFLEGNDVFMRYFPVELSTAWSSHTYNYREQSTMELTAISRIAL